MLLKPLAIRDLGFRWAKSLFGHDLCLRKMCAICAFLMPFGGTGGQTYVVGGLQLLHALRPSSVSANHSFWRSSRISKSLTVVGSTVSPESGSRSTST